MKAVVYFGTDNYSEELPAQKPKETYEQIIRLTTNCHLWHRFDHGEGRYN